MTDNEGIIEAKTKFGKGEETAEDAKGLTHFPAATQKSVPSPSPPQTPQQLMNEYAEFFRIAEEFLKNQFLTQIPLEIRLRTIQDIATTLFIEKNKRERTKQLQRRC